MSGLHITTSNMMEILAARLADVIAEPLRPPLQPEIVLINSRGMERWLSMQLAEQHGVCANMSFLFPRTFLMALLERVSGKTGSAAGYHPDNLVWQIMKILPELSRGKNFTAIRHFLEAESESPALKRYQLALRIARVFDQYLVYRPEMILNWEAGRHGQDDEIWQSELWRQLVRDMEETHPAALFPLFREKILSSGPDVFNLPSRISLIGISALPRLLIDMIHILAGVIDVHLFLFNPCREYWSDILSEREMETRLKQIPPKADGRDEDDLLLEKGNPLLASMGKVSRDFLAAFTDDVFQYQDYFILPGENTLLRTVQSDILNLVDRAKDDTLRMLLLPDDRSLECHSCHSPMREVEVLYNQLLAAFEDDPDLKPRDILVMTPDIDTYAPFIEAVFNQMDAETARHSTHQIPFSIADRKHLRHNPVADALFSILELADSRFEASRVLALLDKPVIRNHFRIDEDETALIHKWVTETGIRWGIDDDYLTEMGLPSQGGYTWRHGIERMLLGCALPGDEDRLFAGRLAYGDFEGDRAELLGRFLDFTDRLFATGDSLCGKHNLEQWQAILDNICAGFLDINDDEDLLFYYRHLQDTLSRLSAIQHKSGFIEDLPLNVVQHYLSNQLEEAGFSGGFLTGGVTFCAMVPMRSIPFKIIVLLGMNHANFPRASVKLGFDLIDRHPRRGDRSKRDDDRYLFLEALLSARNRLMILYTGQNIRDNSLIPPSVVVSELLDYLEQAFLPSGGDDISCDILKRLVIKHPLQPFSPAYFQKNDRFFSYNQEHCRAAQALASPPEVPRSFLSAPLPVDPELFRTVRTTDLIQFFRNPACFFVEKRLGIKLAVEEEAFLDTEMFTLGGLDRYTVAQRILKTQMNCSNPEEEYRVLVEAGQLPAGTVGEMHYRNLAPEIGRFAQQVRKQLPASYREEMTIDITLGDFRLTGRIVLPAPQGLFVYRYAELKGKDYLQTWILHLLLCLTAPDRSWCSRLAGRNEFVEFGMLHDPAGTIRHFLGVFQDGLTHPLPFFPQSSLQYASAIRAGKSPEEALHLARKVWGSTDYTRGEEDNAYYRLCFGQSDPFTETFQRLAESVYSPLLNHLRLLSATESFVENTVPPVFPP